MTRTRSRGGFSNGYHGIYDYSPAGVLQSSSYASDPTLKASGEFATITDVNTKGFKEFQSRGGVIMSPMLLVRDKRECNVETLTFGTHPEWGRRTFVGTLACRWFLPAVAPAWFLTQVNNAKSATLVKAHAKIGAETFQGLVSVAEALKTVRTLANPFKKARDLINRIQARTSQLNSRKKTSFREYGTATAQNARDSQKAFESAWMEMRMGFRPIIYDIQKIADAWLERNHAWNGPVPVRKVVRSMEVVDWATNYPYSNVVAGLTGLTMGAQIHHNTKVSSGVLYEISDASAGDAAARTMGVRLSDVPAAAWELLPHSFVVDRFALVGEWLKAMTPKPGVNVRGSWTTYVEKKRDLHKIVEAVINLSASNPPTRYARSGGRYIVETMSMTREANPVLPLLPPLNSDVLKWQQHVDHAVLISQQIARLKS